MVQTWVRITRQQHRDTCRGGLFFDCYVKGGPRSWHIGCKLSSKSRLQISSYTLAINTVLLINPPEFFLRLRFLFQSHPPPRYFTPLYSCIALHFQEIDLCHPPTHRSFPHETQYCMSRILYIGLSNNLLWDHAVISDQCYQYCSSCIE